MRLSKMTNAPHLARHSGDRGRGGRQGDQTALLAEVTAASSNEFFDDALLHSGFSVVVFVSTLLMRW